MSPWDIPVFRMAYFAQKSHRDFCSKTLMLQVRFAHPPNPAPSYRFFVLFRSAYFPSPRRIGFSSRFAASIEAHCAVSSETLMLQPLRGLRTPRRSPVSSPLAAAAALWLPCVRGAVRRQAGPRGCLRIRGKGKGRRPSPVSAPNRLFKPLRCFARLIRQAETLELQPHSRPPSEHTVLFLPKRSCFRFASLTLRTAHRNLLSEGSGVPHGLFCNSAPSSRFFSVSRRSRLRGCRHRAESTHHLTPSGCVPSGGAVAPPAPPLPPPSRCRPDRFKGSP